jgi:FMN phosphatase YigB (HAD superfamily)
MDHTIKAIIFDYGNVIFSIDFLRTQNAFKELGIENVETFFSHKGHAALFDEFEKGNISAAEWRDGIRKQANKPNLSDQQIDDAWNSLLIGVADGNHDLLLKISKQYPTFLLSNTNEVHYKWIMEYLKKEFNLENNASLFTKDYYSHLMGMRKPNKDIFQYVLDTHGLKAEETLFIDDSPQHLKTAKEMGLQTYLMTAPDNLQLYFKNNGLLRNE